MASETNRTQADVRSEIALQRQLMALYTCAGVATVGLLVWIYGPELEFFRSTGLPLLLIPLMAGAAWYVRRSLAHLSSLEAELDETAANRLANGGPPIAHASVLSRLVEKGHVARLLWDHAISNGLFVSDDLLKKVTEADEVFALGDNVPADRLATVSLQLDLAIRDLTQITAPMTPDLLLLLEARGGTERFAFLKIVLPAVLLGGVMVGIAIQAQASPSAAIPSVVAAVLGALGAGAFILFSLTGAIRERDFDVATLTASDIWVRLVLGVTVGWVLFLVFGQPGAIGQGGQAAAAGTSQVAIFLPFLGGFSSKLVVGIINKAIDTVSETLSLESRPVRGRGLSQGRLGR